MKTFTFQTTLRNPSQWPIDIVWENAQDLEHVAFLHSSTNYSFRLLYLLPSITKEYLYDTLVFRVRRKLLGFIPVTTFGMRRIVGQYEIWQMEMSPLLGTMTTLRSTLELDPGDSKKTVLVDYVEVTVPIIFKPFKNWMVSALRRHTRIQCKEDEGFRGRRAELRDRGINLPLSIFNIPAWDLRFTKYIPGQWRDEGKESIIERFPVKP